MDDLGDLARDLGFLARRRSPPMAAPAAVPSPNPNNTSAAAPLFHSHNDAGFSDHVFGGPRHPTNDTRPTPPSCDKPVYDDDGFGIFDGVAGVETAFSAKYDGASSSSPGPAPSNRASSSPYEDLLGSFAVEEPAVRVDFSVKSQASNGYSGLDDLLPGFGRTTVESKSSDKEDNNNVVPPSTVSSTQSKSAFLEDPFVFLESVTSSTYRSSESAEDMVNPFPSYSRKADNSSPNGEIFDEVDGFDGFVNIKLKSSSCGGSVDSSYASRESSKASCRNKKSGSTLFDVPTSVSDSHVSANGSRPPNMGPDFMETNTDIGLSSRSDGNNENLDEIWLSVSEIPLFTQPTISPPPARPPPKPLVSSTDMNGNKKSHDSVKKAPRSAIDKLKEFATDRHPQPPDYGCSNVRFDDGKKKVKNPPSSAIDELEEFSIGGHPQPPIDGWSNISCSEEDSEANFTAAAMKQAMDKAETKFKYAKEVREREKDDKATNNRDSAQMNEDDKNSHDVSERENRDRQEQLEREQREEEEKEKERKRFEKEKEEREKARRAVEMVTREARERAAIEARLRAERAAVEKATNEARLRAERAAVQKAAAEARERAATEARERAAAVACEKASAEARERAAAEARERAEKAAAEARERQARERAAVERATAEVRLRAQAEAKDRAAAAAAWERQQKSESCFGMSARPTSAPRQRAASDLFDSQFQTKSTDAARAVGTSSNMRKASSTANIVDDLISVFGAVASSTEFQEIDGESEERRKARYERYMRTRERAAKALAEKNERDIQTQKEQEERHRIADRLDIEIKRWASGKEGNLRALLSTLQCVLWPECGWQPVSLVDLITAASVKKVYRKATLCIHPDKVQQKGATLQQKYIAEKVFDLLKEAWNKFNSEELF